MWRCVSLSVCDSQSGLCGANRQSVFCTGTTTASQRRHHGELMTTLGGNSLIFILIHKVLKVFVYIFCRLYAIIRTLPRGAERLCFAYSSTQALFMDTLQSSTRRTSILQTQVQRLSGCATFEASACLFS